MICAFMALLKAVCSGGKLHEMCKGDLVLDMAEVPGLFRSWYLISHYINETELYLTEFPGCTPDLGITDQMKTSPEISIWKLWTRKLSCLTHHLGRKESLPSFLFISWLNLLTILLEKKNKNSFKKPLKPTTCHT